MGRSQKFSRSQSFSILIGENFQGFSEFWGSISHHFLSSSRQLSKGIMDLDSNYLIFFQKPLKETFSKTQYSQLSQESCNLSPGRSSRSGRSRIMLQIRIMLIITSHPRSTCGVGFMIWGPQSTVYGFPLALDS